MKKIKILIFCTLSLLLSGCSLKFPGRQEQTTTEEIIAASSGEDDFLDINADIKESTRTDAETSSAFKLSTIPEYNGSAYVTVNNDVPFFSSREKETTSCYRNYGQLDSLGRATSSIMYTCKEELPDEEREGLEDLKPSGWEQAKYPGIVDSEPAFVYNRSHLLMWALIGNESDVIENVITGTRYFNTQAMLPNEEIVLNFIKSSDMHVLYRVTPYYKGDNLLAEGVLMEAMSVEDNGKSLSLCRWAYNVQPGIKIDYKTGKNEKE